MEKISTKTLRLVVGVFAGVFFIVSLLFTTLHYAEQSSALALLFLFVSMLTLRISLWALYPEDHEVEEKEDE